MYVSLRFDHDRGIKNKAYKNCIILKCKILHKCSKENDKNILKKCLSINIRFCCMCKFEVSWYQYYKIYTSELVNIILFKKP